MKEETWIWSSLERRCLQLLKQQCNTRQSLLQIHALMLRHSLLSNLNLLTKLITTSSNLMMTQHALRLFHHQPNAAHHDTFLCNSIIRAHIPHWPTSLSLFTHLTRLGGRFCPDGYTLTALAKSCALSGVHSQGQGIHSRALKSGLCFDLYVSTALLDMYAKFGKMGSARKVFGEMSVRNHVAWTALVCGYARRGDTGEARRLFDEMPERDAVAFNVLIDGYVKVGEMGLARSLFDDVRDRNVVTWTSMISGYFHQGDVGEARLLFDSMPIKNIISWNVMIGGYCQNKHPHEAVCSFHEMRSSTLLEPNAVTLVSVLPAIADLGALELGRWIHEFAQRKKLDKLTNVCTALVDMYAKCGEVINARRVFEEMPEKETASWNALINGFAVNGHGKEALEIFIEMQREGFVPNNITFLSVLWACNHCGLVEEGRFWFKEMENFGLIPQIEHYGCMVDLLGRAGCLNEAEELFNRMPYDVNGVILSSFLFACAYYEDITRANKILELAMKLEPWNDGNFIMLRNLYAKKRRWNDVDDIKSLMRKNQADKEIGCSFIEVDGRIRQFVAGFRMHTCMEAMLMTLLQSSKPLMGEVPCFLHEL